MENIREKVPMFIAVLVAMAIALIAAYLLENSESIYYTKVDNTKIEKITSTDNMKYKYNLEAYNENGRKKVLEFKTSRELREGAYLMLEVKTFGVHSWKEVQYNELPKKVQSNYNE